MICALCLVIVAGCSQTEPPIKGLLFCDVYDFRTFTQAEIDVRTEIRPTNLKKDFVDNDRYEAECLDTLTEGNL